ncbi:MAG: sodium/proton-translocating pyrophosphatase, partial [Candidatus Cloacimonetes bacterium]|nr:sodium/proton-translocating pyrophosphatase [Candidatus Cloacimonadota bacterium]
AQREMVVPAIVGIGTPIVVGLIFGVAGVLGVLAGALSAGFVLAIMMNNAGGAWDNAKKFVETGECGGKNSPAHTATIVGDTVGDPFKDTAGPCINILIKLMSMVSIVFVGVILSYSLSVERIQPPMTSIKIKEEIHNEIIPIDKDSPHAEDRFLPREMDEELGFRNCGEKWQEESNRAVEEDAKAKEALK